VLRIAVLGDSLAVSPSRDLAFPSILQARIDAHGVRAVVVNAGARGDTTDGGLRRLLDVMSQQPRILVVALGANDGLRGVPVADVQRNLAAIIRRATGLGARVLLCGMETPPIRGWQYTLAFHKVFPYLAAEYNVPLVPFLLTGVALNPELNGEDLIHPNAAGARQIAATVWPYLRPMIEEESKGSVR
jgi:acyl-CoA thioesterase I